jgi:glycosyltransferase involved in cell wall biosynthesis
MHGHGATYLERSLKALDAQTLRDFEVVVSDHSRDGAIETLCRDRSQPYPLRYARNPEQRGNSSANTNAAARHAVGDIVKILHQDDFLYADDALDRIVGAARAAPDRAWGGVGCIHVDAAESVFFQPFVPHLHPTICAGRNTFGAPSVMFVRRARYLDFDEALIWVGDCEIYHRLAQAYGPPIIVSELLVAVRQWSHQVTHTAISEERKRREVLYAIRKHTWSRPGAPLTLGR